MNNETVSLENFVHTALIQIINAVSKKAPEIEKLGGHINPELSNAMVGKDLERTKNGRRMTTIEFDVAITATTGGESQAGIGVLTAIVSAGAKEKKHAIDSTVSRIRFSIPIELPVTPTRY